MDFEREVAPYRRELLAHCYRITGSMADAEDALQDAFVRAWKALPSFEGRSSFRRWLYTIATRTSLDLIGERKRTLSSLDGSPPTDASALDPVRMPPPALGPVWIEPAPDDVLFGDPSLEEGPRDDAPTPEQRIMERESVRFAFLAATQRLPAKQRAALILREVAGYSAEETAQMLELTVPSVNSALQRARESLAEAHVATKPDTRAREEAEGRVHVDAFARAIESNDAHAIASLLIPPVTYSMPPFPLWLQGVDAVRALYERVVFPAGACRVVPTRANGMSALGVYQRGAPSALTVIDVHVGGIRAVHAFLAVDPRLSFARFGLPLSLAA